MHRIIRRATLNSASHDQEAAVQLLFRARTMQVPLAPSGLRWRLPVTQDLTCVPLKFSMPRLHRGGRGRGRASLQASHRGRGGSFRGGQSSRGGRGAFNNEGQRRTHPQYRNLDDLDYEIQMYQDGMSWSRQRHVAGHDFFKTIELLASSTITPAHR